MFCREHVARVRDAQDEIEAAGAGIAAVGLGDARYAAAFREETGIEFPLLVDAERLAYDAVALQRANAFHIVRFDNTRRRLAAMAAGLREHRPGPHPLQLGGSFVFAPGDRDLFVHVSGTFSDNADPEKFIEVLRERAAGS